ncbi:hypothetical protein A1O1_00477 [Capronia coronata CBS 617.96]|uniref:Uncharacterized protein n=1 Tax=Capronia coronata CBS 617.96 TaxID=1182541 RepID=W9YR71_9EURO|nr:uncharacterized protein A1O1_00477 [Capronia coronata CBS 617.96]EXJ95357.1 hypothetical protein A1O1_00477 [Capronia coronata CBS 617.96]
MYRNSAQLNYIPRNAPPSPDSTSDSESDILDALDRKRRQLDEEIARFKAAKDREFRDFEKALRMNRTKPRGAHSNHQSCSVDKNSASSATSTAVLTLLASTQLGGPSNGSTGYKAKRAGDDVGDKTVKPAPLSKATLSIDKLNITGETLPSSGDLATPPANLLLSRTNSRSSPTTSSNTTPPRSKTESARRPPTPSSDRTDSFAGVFTPAYLPLLESRDRPPFVYSPKPMTTQEEETKQLRQLDEDTKKEAERQKPILESSQSLPPQPVSPTIIVASKRAKSTGELSSGSLPSALRSSKSGARKGKHVHFQLADFTVVDPSSSYEESPSPALSPDKEVVIEDGTNSHDRGHSHSKGGTISARRKGSPKHLKLPVVKDRKRARAGRFLSPMPSPLPSPSPSPTTEGSSSSLLASPDESGFAKGLDQADDGGSGVGFFELDEELASPGLREKPFELELEVDPISEDGGVDEKADSEAGLGSSFGAGSVPIDIVRPTGSWIGSFGH